MIAARRALEGTAKLGFIIKKEPILVWHCPGLGSQFCWEILDILENDE